MAASSSDDLFPNPLGFDEPYELILSKRADEQELDRLIANGWDVNEPDCLGVTALEYAVRTKQAKVVLDLLERGAATKSPKRGLCMIKLAKSADRKQLADAMEACVSRRSKHCFVYSLFAFESRPGWRSQSRKTQPPIHRSFVRNRYFDKNLIPMIQEYFQEDYQTQKRKAISEQKIKVVWSYLGTPFEPRQHRARLRFYSKDIPRYREDLEQRKITSFFSGDTKEYAKELDEQEYYRQMRLRSECLDSKMILDIDLWDWLQFLHFASVELGDEKHAETIWALTAKCEALWIEKPSKLRGYIDKMVLDLTFPPIFLNCADSLEGLENLFGNFSEIKKDNIEKIVASLECLHHDLEHGIREKRMRNAVEVFRHRKDAMWNLGQTVNLLRRKFKGLLERGIGISKVEIILNKKKQSG